MQSDQPRRRALWIGSILLVFVFLAGSQGACYEKQLMKKQRYLLEELQEHASAFNRMIVWGDYDGASIGVIPEKRIDFLEQSQEVAARIKIENFSIPLCQVGSVPFPRDLEISPEVLNQPGSAPVQQAPGSEAGLPADAVVPPVVEPVPEGQQAKAEKKKMPKVFYGVALVRFINMTVSPSVSVHTRLIKQYWIYTDNTWFCDADLQQLLE